MLAIKHAIIITALTMGSSLVFCQLTPLEANKIMGRGINLGNTLEPPDEGGWNNPPAEAYYFDAYVEAGFNFVRIPVSWYGHTQTIHPYKIDGAWLDRVEEVVDWGLDRGLIVVLNAHHESWLKDNPSLDNQERFDSIWSQIAVRFKDKSDSLLFEMINEPYPMLKDTVDNLNKRILSIIRKTNPTRIVLFSGDMWSGADQLIQAEIPNDNYLMGYFHSYDPWDFAGEGNGTWGSVQDVNQIISMFDRVSNWSSENNIPVLLGEFGAVKACDFNSRMKHYATYTEQALEHKFSYAVWDDGGNFGVYKRAADDWDELREILIEYSAICPTNLMAVNNNGESVSLTWINRQNEVDSVVVERGRTPTDFNVVYSSVGGLEAYEDTSTSENLYYYYKVGTYSYDTVRYSYPVRVYTDHVSSVQGNNVTDQIDFYPNPVTHNAFLRLPEGNLETEVKILDAEGKVIKEIRLLSGGGTIILDDLSPGIYFLSYRQNESLHVIKFQSL